MTNFQFSEQLVMRDMALKLDVNTIHECPKLLKAHISLTNQFIHAEKLIMLPYFVALLLWTGQRPNILRSTKSIASFHVKKNAPIGCFVTLRKEAFNQFFTKACLEMFPRMQPQTQTNIAKVEQNRVDFGLDSFLKCNEIQSNTDLFDFLEGCSCSISTTGKTVQHTKVLVSSFQFPVF